MMIPVLTDYYEAGYLPRPKYEALNAFFPNCNLSVRKKVFEEVGLYDEDYNRAAEDADLCRRASTGEWSLFYEQEAICYHEARKNLRELMKQWLSYGYYGGRFFQEGQRYRCEIFISFDARPKVNRFFRLFKTNKTPFRILLFLTYFPLFHLIGFFILASLLTGYCTLALFLAGGLLALGLTFYLKTPLRKLSFKQLMVYIMVTYLINLSHILGGLAGGLRRRMLYLYSGV